MSEGSIAALLDEALRSDAAYASATVARGGHTWLRVQHRHVVVPSQGWKLHVSSSVADACDVLRSSLRILLPHRATFKTAATVDALAHLNSGRLGQSQVGKFITVYPRDDDDAVELARALDEVTTGFRSPIVPSDRRLHRDSIVSYRYGAFVAEQAIQLRTGRIVSALVDPKGVLVPDERGEGHTVPEWADDPFVRSDIAPPREGDSPLIDNRYVTVGILQRTEMSTVHLAVDLDDLSRCIVKHADRNSAIGADGRDARLRLGDEADLLRRVWPHAAVPRLRRFILNDDNALLILDDIPGVTLERRITDLHMRGAHLSVGVALVLAQRLARELLAIHQIGVVHGDVKPSNVDVGPDDSVHLLDFNAADVADDDRTTARRVRAGTPGYSSSAQLGEPHPAFRTTYTASVARCTSCCRAPNRVSCRQASSRARCRF